MRPNTASRHIHKSNYIFDMAIFNRNWTRYNSSREVFGAFLIKKIYGNMVIFVRSTKTTLELITAAIKLLKSDKNIESDFYENNTRLASSASPAEGISSHFSCFWNPSLSIIIQGLLSQSPHRIDARINNSMRSIKYRLGNMSVAMCIKKYHMLFPTWITRYGHYG